jgi:hypothetical protein
LSDDGEAITLTGNATTTRTISGSGSLEGSTFAQTPNASLTGMTGTIGSAVALGSATFPAGHVIGLLGKAQDRTRRQYTSRTDNTWYDDYTQLNLTITPTDASSLLWFVGQVHYGISIGSDAGSVYLQFLKDDDATNSLNGDDTQTSGNYPCFHQARWSSSVEEKYHMEQAVINGYIMAGSTNSQVFKIRYRVQAGSVDISFNKDGYSTPGSSPGSHSPSGASHLQIYEVQQ